MQLHARQRASIRLIAYPKGKNGKSLKVMWVNSIVVSIAARLICWAAGHRVSPFPRAENTRAEGTLGTCSPNSSAPFGNQTELAFGSSNPSAEIVFAISYPSISTIGDFPESV